MHKKGSKDTLKQSQRLHDALFGSPKSPTLALSARLHVPLTAALVHEPQSKTMPQKIGTRHKKTASGVNSKLQKICNIYSTKKKPSPSVTKRLPEGNTQVGFDGLSGETIFAVAKNAGSMSSRGSVDGPGTETIPGRQKASLKEKMLALSKGLGRPLAMPRSGAQSPQEATQLDSRDDKPIRFRPPKLAFSSKNSMESAHP
jgi:hypothetical protein